MSKKMIAIAVAASIALVGIWYFAIFSAQSKSIKHANVEAAAANTQSSSVRAQIALLQQERLQLPASKAKLTSLKLALPETPALDKLIDDINGAATTSGVDWQTISPTKPISFTAGQGVAVAATFPGGMQSVTVTLQVGGTPRQILDFVNKLNALSRLVDVTAVNLSGSNTAKGSGQLTTQIFFVPPAAAVTTPTTVAP